MRVTDVIPRMRQPLDDARASIVRNQRPRRRRPILISARNNYGELIYLQYLMIDAHIEVWSDSRKAGQLERGQLLHWLLAPHRCATLANAGLVMQFGQLTGVMVTIPGMTQWPMPRTEQITKHAPPSRSCCPPSLPSPNPKNAIQF